MDVLTDNGRPSVSGGRVRPSLLPDRAAGIAPVLRWLLLLSPSVLALAFAGLVASDRYVSEAQFVVRTAARPASSSLGSFLQMTGLSRAQDDVFSVQAFLGSRSAVEHLAAALPIQRIYGHPAADFLSRYPSIVYGGTIEELRDYLRWMVETTYNSTTGITTLRVQAFAPEDAKSVAELLLQLGEQTVNRLNKRIFADAVANARADVTRGQDQLVESQLAITRFRNAELIIDPASSSVMVTELIARLSADLTQAEAQMREMASAAAAGPVLVTLERRAEALRGQINRERERISDASQGLAQKLAIYERLVLDHEFSKQQLAAAVKSLEAAEQNARRQQLYLERVVEPAVADYPMAPRRLRLIASAIGLNLVALLLGWLIWTGLREHAGQRQ